MNGRAIETLASLRTEHGLCGVKKALFKLIDTEKCDICQVKDDLEHMVFKRAKCRTGRRNYAILEQSSALVVLLKKMDLFRYRAITKFYQEVNLDFDVVMYLEESLTRSRFQGTTHSDIGNYKKTYKAAVPNKGECKPNSALSQGYSDGKLYSRNQNPNIVSRVRKLSSNAVARFRITFQNYYVVHIKYIASLHDDAPRRK